MWLKVSCCKLKLDCYTYKVFYVNFMVTIKEKTIIVTQKMKRKKLKFTTTKNKSWRKTVRDEER